MRGIPFIDVDISSDLSYVVSLELLLKVILSYNYVADAVLELKLDFFCAIMKCISITAVTRKLNFTLMCPVLILLKDLVIVLFISLDPC